MTSMGMSAKFEERTSQPTATSVSLGIHYVAQAAPKKGTGVSLDGTCDWILECYPIDEIATPGEIAEKVFNPKQAKFYAYRGKIAMTRHDEGLMLGYVHDMKGFTSMEGAGVSIKRVTDATPLGYKPPSVGMRPSNKPSFGRAANLVMPYAREMAVWKIIARKADKNFSRSKAAHCRHHGIG